MAFSLLLNDVLKLEEEVLAEFCERYFLVCSFLVGEDENVVLRIIEVRDMWIVREF